jgi:hypothetical protein
MIYFSYPSLILSTNSTNSNRENWKKQYHAKGIKTFSFADHFVDIDEMIKIGKGGEREIKDATHFEVGKKMLQTIEELGGTVPEELPVAEKESTNWKKNEKKGLQRLFMI